MKYASRLPANHVLARRDAYLQQAPFSDRFNSVTLSRCSHPLSLRQHAALCHRRSRKCWNILSKETSETIQNQQGQCKKRGGGVQQNTQPSSQPHFVFSTVAEWERRTWWRNTVAATDMETKEPTVAEGMVATTTPQKLLSWQPTLASSPNGQSPRTDLPDVDPGLPKDTASGNTSRW